MVREKLELVRMQIRVQHAATLHIPPSEGSGLDSTVRSSLEMVEIWCCFGESPSDGGDSGRL